jgi:N-acetyl-gamma-glutamyl-phosphate/LysW-gamma-L-alpha-aminoadipyl-6-phosphate reductase
MGWTETSKVQMSVTAIDMVRGILATLHVFTPEKLQEKDLWRIFRDAYQDEPFMRIVKDRQGIYRYPEPKILIGSNYCDVSFEIDEHWDELYISARLIYLMQGAAGNAVQAMNVMCGFRNPQNSRFRDFTGIKSRL